MELKEEHLKERPKVVGKTGDGRPIVMAETKGGLFAFFTKSKDGKVETLAAAPHRAIGAFFCEQKDRGIEWNDKLDELSKSGADELFQSLRARMMSPELSLHKSETEYYLHYDQNEGTIELLHKDELMLVDSFSFVRKSDFSEPLCLAYEIVRKMLRE